MRIFLKLSSVVVLATFFVAALNAQQLDCITNHTNYFKNIKYKASIDVVGKHVSGILIFSEEEKEMYRAIFITELGVTLFDMRFTPTSYIYRTIIDALDKKAVKKTLAKDIGMILGLGIFSMKEHKIKQNDNQLVFERHLKSKGTVRYYTDSACRRISKIENFGRKKRVVLINQYYLPNTSNPDSIFVSHSNVNFTIALKQLHATE